MLSNGAVIAVAAALAAAVRPPKSDTRFSVFKAATWLAAALTAAARSASSSLSWPWTIDASRSASAGMAACSAVAGAIEFTSSVAVAVSAYASDSSSNTMGFSAVRCISSLMRATTSACGTPSVGLPATLTTLLPTMTPCTSPGEPGATLWMVTHPSTSPNVSPRRPGPKVTVRREDESGDVGDAYLDVGESGDVGDLVGDA